MSVEEPVVDGVKVTAERARRSRHADTVVEPDSFAGKLTEAFDTICPPSLGGRRLGTVAEAAKGMTDAGHKVNQNTIWAHKSGAVGRPSWDVVQGYAEWFGQSTDFFRRSSSSESAAPPTDPAEKERQEKISRLVIEIEEFDDEALDLVDDMLRVARERQRRSGKPRRRPSASGGGKARTPHTSSAPEQ